MFRPLMLIAALTALTMTVNAHTLTATNSINPHHGLEVSAQMLDRAQTQASTVDNKIKKPVYLCGALTKKGTLCKRHVKAAGTHCWQHGGKGGK